MNVSILELSNEINFNFSKNLIFKVKVLTFRFGCPKPQIPSFANNFEDVGNLINP